MASIDRRNDNSDQLFQWTYGMWLLSILYLLLLLLHMVPMDISVKWQIYVTSIMKKEIKQANRKCLVNKTEWCTGVVQVWWTWSSHWSASCHLCILKVRNCRFFVSPNTVRGFFLSHSVVGVVHVDDQIAVVVVGWLEVGDHTAGDAQQAHYWNHTQRFESFK